ncbi:F-box/kelch-repeat protein At1g51550-like [Aristolochia californica]|uniref:F-box/kelch-repeat protein At1g51550-like n=1 Tax=Aristolochia californica TaxID=171875 RepID=UPI0035D58C90
MAEAKNIKSCITRLAHDHIFYILHLLPIESILSFSMTCKRFRTAVSSDGFWQSICRRDFGSSSVDGLLASYAAECRIIHWKQLYQQVSQFGSVSCVRLAGKDGISPIPRASHSLNCVADCLVLFGGGCEGGRHLDDTWITHTGNGFQHVLLWQQINSGGPTGRFGQSCSVIGDRLVLFGGINDKGKRQNDTWIGHVICNEKQAINLSWELLDVGPNAPPPRGAHAGCCVGEKMVIHGGIDIDGSRLNDTWLLDLRDGGRSATWHEIIALVSPPARSGHTLTWIGGTLVILFGGRGNGYEVHNDLWLFNIGGEYPEWVKLVCDTSNVPVAMPDPRVGHSATLILGGQVLIYGGEDSQMHRKDDFWVLDPSVILAIRTRSHALNLKRSSRKMWKRLKIEGHLPSRRSFHRACANQSGQSIYLYGGMVDGPTQLAEAVGLRFDGDMYLVKLLL